MDNLKLTELKIDKIKNQKYLCAAVCMCLIMLPVIQFFGNVFGQTSLSSVTTAGCYAILMFFIARCIPYVILNLKADMFFVMIFIILSFMMTDVFYPENIRFAVGRPKSFMDNLMIKYFVFTLPVFILARLITDFEMFEKYLLKFSVFSLICSLYNGFFVDMDASDYMSYSYNMLLQVFVVFVYGIENKKRTFMLIGIAGIIAIILSGARGPLLGLVIGIVLYMMFFGKNTTNKVRNIFFLILLSGLIYVFFYDIIEMLIGVADYFEVESRTLTKILENEFFDSSGRDKIYKEIFAHMSVVPKGIYGETQFVNAAYAHNIFLELMVAYGYLLGGILCFVIVILVYKGLFSNNRQLSKLILYFSTIGFFKFFLSSSIFMQEPGFYVLMAICVTNLGVLGKTSEEVETINDNV